MSAHYTKFESVVSLKAYFKNNDANYFKKLLMNCKAHTGSSFN